MFDVCRIGRQGARPGRRSQLVRHALLPCLAVATLQVAGCVAPLPCAQHSDCGAFAECLAGSCVPSDSAAPGGEGEREVDGPRMASALVVVPGLLAAARPYSFTLPLALDVTDVELDEVGVDDCAVRLEGVDAAAASPLTLSLQCATLHLGTMEVPLVARGSAGDVEIALTVRLVPSDWHDLERAERELVTLDVVGLLDGAPVPTGAPVFLADDRLPEGALQQSPRLLAVNGDEVEELAWEADGAGLWFALPASGRVWVYFAPIAAAPAPSLVARPWDAFTGVWHLENGADASDGDGADDLEGEATPSVGMVGGAAGFDGEGGLDTWLDLDPTQGALSAWVRLAPAGARTQQVAVGVGDDLAVGAFDPEGVALYTDDSEQACAYVGAGLDEPGALLSSSGPAALADGGWHHVAVRWQNSARDLWVDGVLARHTDGVVPTQYRFEALSVGGSLDFSEPWLGDVDEVRLSGQALPASWFQAEHASVTGLVTDRGRPFVQGLRPDLLVQSATATRVAEALPPISVVPHLERGVLVSFVAARGEPATGASLESVTLSPLAPAAQGSGLSLAALSYEGALDGSPLQVDHAGAAPDQVVVATLAFPGGTERGLAGIDLAAAPIVAAAPRLALEAAAPTAGAAWILVAVASSEGVLRCDACGRHVVGPVSAGDGLVLDVFAGEREPTAHTLEPVTAAGDDAAVVVVRVGP